MGRPVFALMIVAEIVVSASASVENGGVQSLPKSDSNTTESLEPLVNGVMKRLTRELQPIFEGILENDKVDSKCLGSIIQLLRGMQRFDFWAYSFVRSSGGLGPMLEGSATDLGMYDACLDAKATDGEENVLFTGRYCTLFILVENEYLQRLLIQGMYNYKEISDYVHGDANLYFDYMRVLQRGRIGVCLPSTCSGDDIVNIVTGRKYAMITNRFCASTDVGGKYGIQAWVPACRSKVEDPSLTAFQIFVIVLLASLVILSSSAAFITSVSKEKSQASRSGLYEILECFSLKRNWSSVFEISTRPQTSYLSCIHGIRAVSCLYVLWGHIYMTVDPFTLHYPMQILRWFRHNISFVPVYMGFYIVDTFFCVTGLLVYRALKLESEKRKPSTMRTLIVVALFRRWIRLVVPSMAVVAFFFLWPAMVSGPTKDLVMSHLVNGCVEHWWTIPAMVGNFYQMPEQCLLHLWYIGVDFQLLVILLIPLILLMKPKFRWIGLIALCSLAILSIVSVFAITFFSELPPFMLPLPLFLKKLPDFVLKIYFNPISHLISSIVGIFFGYLIEKHRSGLSTRRMSLLWVAVTVVCLLNFYVPFYWQTGGEAFTVWAALYNAFSRGFWSLGVGWVIFACATDHGGIVNKILSQPVLLPLSRISLSFYLVHILVVATRAVQQRSLVEAQHYLLVKHALSDIVISFFFALMLHCLVAAPVVNLDKLMFARVGRTEPEDEKRPNGHSLKAIIVGGTDAALKDRL
ncbi:nose resistant to fluoxetine protein 6-like [Galendromus occidentalis]|uniref:Nose resistant to fluoxetine protein 6-like n=1 Tax=Galendromus occidentalis TaxID=34638 RepID=A0AAJ6VXF0_9ACAR|nr:nose resistant to fluoxetine protein 6-like [Galendromus occidentalis]